MSDEDLTIDRILDNWNFNTGVVTTRHLKHEGREVIQLRIDMGLLQMETSGRPDGQTPHDCQSILHWIQTLETEDLNEPFRLDFNQCMEVDREFAQFYHRRICWMQLKEFARAVGDADHTLALMDACLRHSPNQDWSYSHEQH